MSYILTALKKSEAERAKGSVPRLTVQPAPATRARGVAWPWILGAALVANVAVVVFAWGPEVPLLTGNGWGIADMPAVTGPPEQAVVDVVTAPAAPANGVEPASLPEAQRAPAEAEAPSAPARRAEARSASSQAVPADPAGQRSRMDRVAARDAGAQDNLAPKPQAHPRRLRQRIRAGRGGAWIALRPGMPAPRTTFPSRPPSRP
jgi:general secretion pathway protein B